ncbi:MAG: PDZ domain-containing protein [Phycisphaerales bacterium]|nr:PDZ domain-containing protein [Phycisphaerales bacterium]
MLNRIDLPVLISLLLSRTLPAAFAFTAGTPPPVEYTLSLPAPHTQMVEMSITVPQVQAESLDFILPVWRPGRYTILDPASSVREVRASNAVTGEALPIEKVRKSAWRVSAGGAESVRVDYRIYANSLGDRTRHVDDTHAFLSGSSVFLFVPQRRDHPAVVRIDAPPDWRIASGLESHPTEPRTLVAPNYDVLVDSPIEVGVHERIDFDVDGTPHEVILWGDVEGYDEQKIIDDFSAIIRAQRDIFGDLPYRRYVFLTHVGMGAGGGTEHLNSTIMQTSRAALESDSGWTRFLGLVSHEFFHTWNVKQLRPAGIHPYDYEQENYTRLLWVAEGTTSYYDDLTLVRTGRVKPKKYLEDLGSAIDSLRRRPGRLVQSVEESSFDAWIKFSRSTPDDVNSTISFYTSGAQASLAFDLAIRTHTGNAASLDDVMRTMYERFPLSGPGYTPADLLAVINEISGADFTGFFERHIRGTEDFPFESLVSVCGLELVFEPAKQDEDKSDSDDSTSRAGDEASRAREEAELDAETGDADEEQAADDEDERDDADDVEDSPEAPAEIPMRSYLGLNLAGTRITSLPSDGPAYASGLMVGDEIIAAEGKRINSQSDLDKRVEKLQPGETIRLTFFRREELREIAICLAAVPDGSWKLRKVQNPTDEQKAAYESWLGQEW